MRARFTAPVNNRRECVRGDHVASAASILPARRCSWCARSGALRGEGEKELVNSLTFTRFRESPFFSLSHHGSARTRRPVYLLQRPWESVRHRKLHRLPHSLSLFLNRFAKSPSRTLFARKWYAADPSLLNAHHVSRPCISALKARLEEKEKKKHANDPLKVNGFTRSHNHDFYWM